MSGANHATTLSSTYKPDIEQAKQRMRAYWAGEIIDRPCVSICTPKENIAAPYRSLILAPDHDYSRAVTEFEEWASCMFYGGEAMPAIQPNYGPDEVAAFIGANMTLVPEMDTSWIEPYIKDWESCPPLEIQPGNKWFQGILELARLAADNSNGRYVVSTIDTHLGLDCLSALRGPERLCMDLIEYPEHVLRALEQLSAIFQPVYEMVYEAGRMNETGTTSWVDMWSEKKTQAVQCDFCYMISPEHFRRFVLPTLEQEIDYLDHAVYHLDGAGQLAHLDDLLAIPKLHTIQWVPGAGQPTAPAWLDVLKHIQKAGKSLQLLVTPEEVKFLHKELDPAKTFYWVLTCNSEQEARELIRWLEVNS